MSNEEKIDIFQAKNNLAFDEPLAPNDSKVVNLGPARGNFTLKRLYKEFNIEGDVLHQPPRKKYLLFTGHRGCGKSTELLRVADYLHDKKRYYVIQLDCVKTLDTNDLKYTDVILALTSQLLQRLQKDKIAIDNTHLNALEDWFKTRVITQSEFKDFKSDLTAGVEIKPGLPFLAKASAELTNKIGIGATYRDDVREVIKNNASELAESFNALIRVAEENLQKNGFGERILFTIDGTDRLSKDDSYNFFVEDINQLTLIESLFIYCTPIHLLNGNNALKTNFASIVRLPMLKIRDCENKAIPENYSVVREMIHHRVPTYLFDNEKTVDYLIKYSGGHPRELLRLINIAINYCEDALIDQASAECAVRELASDYRRSINSAHYARLVEIDQNPDFPDDFTDNKTTKMLFDLMILEYNDFFWKSHPVITTLPGYKKAEKAYLDTNEE